MFANNAMAADKGLILSVIWLSVFAAIRYIHAKVLLGGHTTPAQDAAVSETYAIATGLGLAVLWVICCFRFRSTSTWLS